MYVFGSTTLGEGQVHRRFEDTVFQLLFQILCPCSQKYPQHHQQMFDTHFLRSVVFPIASQIQHQNLSEFFEFFYNTSRWKVIQIFMVGSIV